MTERVGSTEDGNGIRKTQWFDPDMPVIEIGKDSRTAILQPSELSKRKGGNRIIISRESASREWASLIYTAVDTNLGLRVLKVHPMPGGLCVPSGQDVGQVRVCLLDGVQHSSSSNVVKVRFPVKGHQYSSRVSFSNVLDGFDHLVGAIRATNFMLQGSSTCYN